MCLLFRLAALLLSLSPGSASAQIDYPTRTVRLVIGAGAGTPPDSIARVLADTLSQTWRKPVVVENAIGASGNIGGDRVARAEPDGHTLLLAVSSGIVMNPSLYERMPFDPVKDLAPISIVCSYPNILVVRNGVAARTVQELVALAHVHPGELTFASAGAGTSLHLAAELLKSMARIDILHVPYSGGAHIWTDMMAGRVDILFGPPANVLTHARHGRIRALAVSSAKRYAIAPELPTVAEAGFPGFDMTVWLGLMAPAGVSAEVIDKVHRDTVKVLALPEVRKRFHDLGVEPVGSSPAELSTLVGAELPKWAKIIKDAGIRLD